MAVDGSKRLVGGGGKGGGIGLASGLEDAPWGLLLLCPPLKMFLAMDMPLGDACCGAC
jgi:hypothetical protein